MAILVSLLIGLVWWICAWTFGIKAFDAFLVTLALVVGAVGYRLFVAPITAQFKP